MGRCVTVFGSAPFPKTHSYFVLTRALGAALAEAKFTVKTGGVPGLMEAANRDAHTGKIENFPMVLLGVEYWCRCWSSFASTC